MKLKRDAFVWTAEALCGVFWLGMLLFTAISYCALPDTVAIHFDAAGNANGWGGKGTLWLMVVFSLLLYILITAVSAHPGLWNVPARRREESQRQVYRLTYHLIAAVKCGMMGIFCYVQAFVVAGAQQGFSRLGPELTFGLIFAIAVPLIVYGVRLHRIGP